jgi:hypothetical protein
MGAIANPIEDVFPGKTHRTVSIQLVEPFVQFLALGASQRNGIRLSRKILPEFLQEA